MTKITKPFMGASHSSGEIYPREYKKGENCPPDLLASAIELGAVDKKEGEAALAKIAADAEAEAE